MSDWTIELVQFGDSCNWQMPARRGLKRFREFSGIATAEGFSADLAFRRDWAALAEATPAERAEARCRADVRAIEARQKAAREAARQAAERKRDELIAANRDRCAWYLHGLYMEEESLESFTLREIEDWVRWARGYVRVRPGHMDLTAALHEGNQVCHLVDLKHDFYDPMPPFRPAPSFESLVRDLIAHRDRCRAAAAAKN